MTFARLLLPVLILFAVVGAPLIADAQTCSATAPCPTGKSCLAGQCITGTGDLGDPNPGGQGDEGDPNPGSGSTGLTNPLKNIDSLPKLLEVVLDAIVDIGTIILTLALVYVGFLFVVAQGNEEKIRNAKSALLWTVIGGLILLGASAIGAVIKSTVETL